MMMMIVVQKMQIGTVAIAEQGGSLTNLFFVEDTLPDQVEDRASALLTEAFLQLELYLNGELRMFSLPLAPAGTPFMQHVWRVVSEIPYGETASYREVASAVGNPRACRAVGMANHRNPLPLFIPCHRVIGIDGSLTGYRGGLALKRQLLEMEGGV